MKKLFTLLLITATCVGTIFASDISVDGIWYNFNSTTLTAEVTYSGPLPYTVNNEYLGTVTIPSTVTYNGKIYSITSIADFAFQNCSGLTSITIPNSVISIGNEAFSMCYSLTSVTIPNSVTSIGDYAFYQCTGMTSIDIPNSVTSIGFRAFYGCSGLTSVTIPNSVISIEKWVFENCCGLTSVSIPNSITSIGDGAFNNCSSLTSIEIPNSVTSIGWVAFSHCTSLTSVTINSNNVLSKNYSSNSSIKGIFGAQVTDYIIGDDVTSIGNYAFQGCTSLTSVTIPNSVTSIGDMAFYGCSGLTSPVYNEHVFAYLPTTHTGSYTIPGGIEYIAGGAFNNCSSLTSIEIPNSVTSIGDMAFYGCSGLTSVTIPNSVTSIREGAFASCDNLIYLIMEGDLSPSIDSEILTGNTTIICVPCGTADIYKNNWSMYASQIAYYPSTDILTIESTHGIIEKTSTICEGDFIFRAIPDSGYHFAQWSDGNTENPRIIEHTPDSTLGVLIVSNSSYKLNVSCDSTYGAIDGEIGYFESGTEHIYTAIPKYGYHFAQWSDGSTENPRIIVVESNVTVEALFTINTYNINCITDMPQGTVQKPDEMEYLQEVEMTAVPNYGYRFTQWSDGNTDNPRTFVITQDTTFEALFVPNSYSLNVICDSTYGTIEGEAGSFEYKTEHTYAIIPNYGYHFTQWSDGNTENPRTITVDGDSTIIAIFANNTYDINGITDTQQGTIQIPDETVYLQEVEITAVPNNGYRFTQWSDGVIDNPRTIVLTNDTTFEALFVITKSGTCGNNNLLTWQYDDKSKTLTINGRGALTENYTYGVEAPTQMNNLIIGNDVTAIGERAFYKTNNIYHLVIGANVASISDYAFAECKNFDDITCYADEVPDISAKTFANVGNKQYIYLFVPQTSQRRYLRDTYWSEFDIQVLNAESVTTTSDVKVTPEDNTATITWPSVEGAETYEIEITKDGVVVCTLIFNSNGQLSGIAFSPNRNNTQQAQTTGFKFTVTGLSSNTQYNYSVTSKDSNNTTIDTQTGSFETTGEVATELDNIDTSIHVHKLLHNGQILILRGDKTYTLQGQEVK